MTLSASDALERLRSGNARFVASARNDDSLLEAVRRVRLVEVQAPFAIVLGCSDARVPAELVFDQGLGDLFVIRVAGNIVAPSQVGSVEFAAAQFGTPLVVVLGHTSCGAIRATLDDLQRKSNHSPNVQSIVSRIRPSVQTLLESSAPLSDDELWRQAVRANVRASVDHLRHGSALLEDLVQANRLRVVGAEYSLETGEVDFFDVDI